MIEQSIIGAGVSIKEKSTVMKGCLLGDGVMVGPGAKIEAFERLSVKPGMEVQMDVEEDSEDEDEDKGDDDSEEEVEEDGLTEDDTELDSDIEEVEKSRFPVHCSTSYR